MSRLDAPQTLERAGLEPRINSPGFALIAWVKLSPETGGVLIEKPVGSAPESRALPCWQWHVGVPADRFSYGAHDFGGETGMFWNVSAGVSSSADGKLHMVAVVVNQSSVSFYTDAMLNKQVPIANPVTDCGSKRILIGDATTPIPVIGEMTFFPRAITTIEMSEIMTTGIYARAHTHATHTCTHVHAF